MRTLPYIYTADRIVETYATLSCIHSGSNGGNTLATSSLKVEILQRLSNQLDTLHRDGSSFLRSHKLSHLHAVLDLPAIQRQARQSVEAVVVDLDLDLGSAVGLCSKQEGFPDFLAGVGTEVRVVVAEVDAALEGLVDVLFAVGG